MTVALVFQIKTIPDTDGLRLLYDLPQKTSADDVANIALHQQRQQNGTDFLPHHLQRICAISCALREGENFKVWSLGDVNAFEVTSSEIDLIQDFFAILKQYKPQIISWNGTAYDLPVLNYRALIHGINASAGLVLSTDHLDLKANLSMFNCASNALLNDLAKLCGFPGKLGVAEINTWNTYKTGDIATISHDCESDVVNTYLLFLRFKLMHGQLSRAIYEAEIALVRETLAMPQWLTFLAAWK